jgi:hypothetical protein
MYKSAYEPRKKISERQPQQIKAENDPENDHQKCFHNDTVRFRGLRQSAKLVINEKHNNFY